MNKIVFAGGCFWGVEEYFSRIEGVTSTKVGYANGQSDETNYEMVGSTGHSEAVYIEYDKNVVSLSNLLKKYWAIIDPTLKDRQGPDIGRQYRTGIYYMDENDVELIHQSVQEEQKRHDRPIVTDIEPLKNFIDAEEYHQKYLKKNPGGYCHIDFSKI